MSIAEVFVGNDVGIVLELKYAMRTVEQIHIIRDSLWPRHAGERRIYNRFTQTPTCDSQRTYLLKTYL